MPAPAAASAATSMFAPPRGNLNQDTQNGPFLWLPIDGLDTPLKQVSALDSMNPLVNKLWYPKGQGFTLAEYMRHIQLLYTKENLLSAAGYLISKFTTHADYISPEGCSLRTPAHHRQVFDKVFSTIPEEHLWVFHFLQLYSLDNNLVTLTYYEPRSIEQYDNELIFSYSGQRFISSWASNDQTNSLALVFSEKARHIEQCFEPYLNTHCKTNAFYGPNPFSANYLQFLSDHLKFYTTDATPRTNHCTTELKKILERPGTRLSFRTSEEISICYNLFHVSQSVSSTYRDPLYKIYEYSQSPLSLIDWPLILPTETDPILYGVELECTTDYSIRQIIDAAPEPFFIAKKDSSITGSKSNRMELVTVPMSLKALKLAYAHWFKRLDYKQFDVTTKTGCGMHVHIGRKHFHDETHIQRFCWFFHSPANTEFIVALSERGSLEHMSAYTPIYQFQRGLSKFKAYRGITKYLQGQRGATNLGSGKGTIEVRIFKGIVSYASIIKNLEAVDALFQYTADAVFTELNVEDFISWLNKTPTNKYTVLKKFLSQIDKRMIFANADIKDIIFTEDDPQKIFEMIKKSGLKITNAHVSILNKGRKRTFILDKVTGEFKMKQADVGTMSWMDRELEAIYTRPTEAAA